MMKKQRNTKQFKKDLKKLLKRGNQKEDIDKVVHLLRNGTIIDRVYQDHALSGNLEAFRELHISSDWLLIYQTTDTEVRLIRTGTHSDLFKL